MFSEFQIQSSEPTHLLKRVLMLDDVREDIQDTHY
jgi:hypothetical protein